MLLCSSVLIISCPCDLRLATPMSIMVATRREAPQGIPFRDAAAIERVRKVDTLTIAALAMSLSLASIVGSALRLRQQRVGTTPH
ncbi:hypothetical protein BOTU111921_02790 [Bordetella tumbae]